MPYKLIPFNKWPTNVFTKLSNVGYTIPETSPLSAAWIDGKKTIAYAFITQKTTTKAYIEWIWATRGNGTAFLKVIQSKLRRAGFSTIELHVSIDPNERQQTVLRRINFYIKNNYRVTDITFRPKNGPLFTMVKTFRK